MFGKSHIREKLLMVACATTHKNFLRSRIVFNIKLHNFRELVKVHSITFLPCSVKKGSNLEDNAIGRIIIMEREKWLERNSDISRHSVYLSFSEKFSAFHFISRLCLFFENCVYTKLYDERRESRSFKWNVKVENYFLTRDSCWEYNFYIFILFALLLLSSAYSASVRASKERKKLFKTFPLFIVIMKRTWNFRRCWLWHFFNFFFLLFLLLLRSTIFFLLAWIFIMSNKLHKKTEIKDSFSLFFKKRSLTLDEKS